jgi:murein DD-endopeptidase MepM/ murein hydrolase activator NlpD
VASANGIVAASGQPLAPYDSAYGVILNHGAGIQSWYWHMQARVIVHEGQKVTSGQLIGYEGSTGFSTGCHLHFAINVNGDWRNPTSFLP